MRQSAQTSAPDAGRSIQYMPAAKLVPAKLNPKEHDFGAIQTSMDMHGYVEPVVLDERTERLVSGHGRIEVLLALAKKGAAPPDGVKLDAAGAWLVPVVRGWRSEDDAQANAFLLASNRTSELGGWDNAALTEVLEDLAKSNQMLGSGYDADDLDELLEQLGPPPAVSPPDDEEFDDAERIEQPWVKAGQLFELGAHRLLVADSFNREHVARLLEAGGVKEVSAVITDPPYAIYGSSTGIGADIADDKMVRPFFEQLHRTILDLVPIFAHVYMFCDWRTWPTISSTARGVGMSVKNCLVWDKGGSGLGSMWSQTYEMIGFLSRLPPPKAMSGRKETGQRTVYKPNVLRFNRPAGAERQHNAAKPVALLRELVEAATDKGQVVADFFGGSGSTMMACEQTERRALLMEIEPKFAQVTVERWQKATGQKAIAR